jgi:hypothetical protein
MKHFTAWDVSGAVVWSVLSIEGLRELIVDHLSPSDTGELGIWVVVFSLAAVYCIARLCGVRA